MPAEPIRWRPLWVQLLQKGPAPAAGEPAQGRMADNARSHTAFGVVTGGLGRPAFHKRQCTTFVIVPTTILMFNHAEMKENCNEDRSSRSGLPHPCRLRGRSGTRRHEVGKGRGRKVAIVAGTLLDAMLGEARGHDLDEADRIVAAQATQKALEGAREGERQPWRNPDSGNTGWIAPTRTWQHRDNGAYRREFQAVLYQRRRFRTHGPIFGSRWRRCAPVERRDCSRLGSSDRGCRRSF